MVENVLEKAYAAEACTAYLWYKLISLLSASDWSKILLAKAYATGTCMRYSWYKLLVNMTKVEYIQRGFCTGKYFLLLNPITPGGGALFARRLLNAIFLQVSVKDPGPFLVCWRP